MLTGVTPFDPEELIRAGIDEMRRTIREREPTRPSTRLSTLFSADLTTAAKLRSTEAPRLVRLVRGDLDWIVMKALEKDRTHRYDGATAFADDILRHLANEPIAARPRGALYRAQKFIRRNKATVTGVSAVVLSLIAGLALSSTMFFKERAARARATHAEGQADAALKNETLLRRQAQRAADEVRRTLAASDLAGAIRLIEEGQSTEALPYLARSIETDPGNGAALTRLATLLSRGAWLMPVREYRFEEGVNAVHMSPDGSRFVTAGEELGVRLFDSASGQVLKSLGRRPVLSLAFRRDSQQFATGSAEGILQFHSGLTGEPLSSEIRLAGDIYQIAYTPDGGQAAVAVFEQKRVSFWDTKGFQEILPPLDHATNVICAGFSPDGTLMATATLDGRVWFWDAANKTPREMSLLHDSPVLGLSFASDGKRLITGATDGVARVWDLTSRTIVAQTAKANGYLRAVEFHPEGDRFLTASDDGTARVWEASTGRPLSAPLHHKGPISGAQFVQGGQQLLTGSWDRTIRLWGRIEGNSGGVMFAHPGLRCASFSPDARMLVTGSTNGTARIWESASGRSLGPVLRHDGPLQHVEFSPDGARLMTASADGTAQLWAVGGSQPLGPVMEHPGPVRFARFSPDGLRLVTVFNQSFDPFAPALDNPAPGEYFARVWDGTSGLPLTQTFLVGASLKSLDFSRDGGRLVVASGAGAQVFEAATGRVVGGPFRQGPVWRTDFWLAPGAASLSPDGRFLLSASTDDSIRIWNTASGELALPALQQPGIVWTAQYSPDGSRFVTASKGNVLRVWDAATGAPVTPPINQVGAVSALFSPDGHQVLGIGTSTLVYSTLRLRDAGSGFPLTEELLVTGQIASVQFSRDGRKILSATRGNTAQIFDVKPSTEPCPPWLLSLSHAIAGQKLEARGLLGPIETNQTEALNQVRQQVRRAPADDAWAAWGRWLLEKQELRPATWWAAATGSEWSKNALSLPLAESRVAISDSFQQTRRAVQQDMERMRHVDECARHAKWSEAREELAAIVQGGRMLGEVGFTAVLCLAAIDVYLGPPVYSERVAESVERLSVSDESGACTVAYAALLNAPPQPRLKSAVDLARRAAGLYGKRVEGRFVPDKPSSMAQVILAFANYRAGDPLLAVQLANEILRSSSGRRSPEFTSQIWSVLALSHRALDQQADAQAALATAKKGIADKLMQIQTGCPDDSWLHLLIASILLREAESRVASE